jgi:hypothetical protein
MPRRAHWVLGPPARARRQTIVLKSDPFLREETDFITAVRGGPDRIRVPYAEALRTHRLTLRLSRRCARTIRR